MKHRVNISARNVANEMQALLIHADEYCLVPLTLMALSHIEVFRLIHIDCYFFHFV